MNIKHAQNGDCVYTASTIQNDGSVPDVPANEIFAEAGTMGVLLNTGHYEDAPGQTLYLVCFRNEAGELGAPVVCLAHELRLTPLLPA